MTRALPSYTPFFTAAVASGLRDSLVVRSSVGVVMDRRYQV